MTWIRLIRAPGRLVRRFQEEESSRSAGYDVAQHYHERGDQQELEGPFLQPGDLREQLHERDTISSGGADPIQTYIAHVLISVNPFRGEIPSPKQG